MTPEQALNMLDQLIALRVTLLREDTHTVENAVAIIRKRLQEANAMQQLEDNDNGERREADASTNPLD